LFQTGVETDNVMFLTYILLELVGRIAETYVAFMNEIDYLFVDGASLGFLIHLKWIVSLLKE